MMVTLNTTICQIHNNCHQLDVTILNWNILIYIVATNKIKTYINHFKKTSKARIGCTAQI